MKYFIYFEMRYSQYNWEGMLREFDDIYIAKAVLDRMIKSKGKYRNVSDILIKLPEP